MKRRFYILGLSLLVLVIALAGLLSVLDVLPKSPNAPSNPGQTVAPPPKTTATATPPTSQPVNLTPDINPSPNFSIALPKSFKLDLSKATDPGLGLKAAAPPHYPLMEVTGAKNTQYLKSITASYYDGTEWLQNPLSGYVPYNGEMLVPPNLDPNQIVTDNITVQTLVDIVNGKVAIPTSLYPVSVNSSEPLLYFPEDMTFLSEEQFPADYMFETIHYIFSRQQLANADLDAVLQYLQLPDNITPRTYELADNLTGGIESPYLMAKAIEDYLKTNYTYDFNAQSAPAGTEPNDWFLFSEKRGVCTNFNSAFVILCRAAGIPARLAGGFYIEEQAEPQTVYADQAHAWSEVKFKELGWQTFDATGSSGGNLPVTLTGTNTEITTVNPVATKGDEFTVAGTVWTDKARPVEGTLVEILVNATKNAKGATRVGEGIVANGRFEIKAIIPGEMAVGKYQVIAHSLPSIQYQESWSDPAIKVVSATNIKLDLPAKVKMGETLTVTGLLSGKFGEALARQPLGISLEGQGAPSVMTDNAGKFTWQTTLNKPGTYSLKVYFAGTEYFLATQKEASLRVLAPAVIELKAKGDTTGKPISFSGTLKEQITNEPLANRTLSVLIDNVLKDIQPTSDNKGNFGFKYTFSETGKHQIEVKFNGDADYFETSTTINVETKIAATFAVWPIIIVVLALGAAGTTGWFLYRRMKNHPIRPLPSDGEASLKTEDEAAAPTAWQSSNAGATLTIDFPQIQKPLPDVWGMGEELQIALHLTDETGKGITAPLEISINNEAPAVLTTGADGTAILPYIFPGKGQHNIAANYGKETDEKKASAARPIRIVDYREEIVDLFNRLIAEFRGMGIVISDEFTPRKIQYLVTAANTGIPEKALEDAVNCFEETDYSLHQITREHYVKMYLARMEIARHGKPTAAV